MKELFAKFMNISYVEISQFKEQLKHGPAQVADPCSHPEEPF